ncbi:DUF4494 domain-containing protein [Bacteroides uniformis]|jgi:hypothetical protein|uniref:DUF4494 domain-containing protein n=1 Tax=Bacteroides uniformis TaxID=820 RepID=A0A3E4R7V2_BACUN|nr:DUF4494 domain-containing protein [Bacteroides uniformis]RGL16333.1 DUF4494 domain-containing protein [Bacteroides uniformis]
MENMNLWETAVIRDVTQEDGTIKAQTEHYLVHSLSCTDAEKRIIEELAPSCCGDLKVTDIKTRKFREVLPSENESDDKWYMVKAYIITLNEKTGEEKRTAVQYLVQASNLKKAISNFEHSMEGSMVDFELDDVKFSPIIEVFSLPEEKD